MSQAMKPFASLARAAWCTTFALALASACGGHSVQGNGGDAGDTGSGSTTGRAGSSSSGSTSSRAGSSSTGSTTGRAGNSSSGGSSGSVGSACSGSPVIPRPDGGGCAAAIRRWTHDSTTGLCQPFIFGGCDGTANNYETLEACQNACPGGKPNYDACQLPADCVLAPIGCCGVCDGTQVSAHDFVAYNRQYEAEASPCRGADIACDPCLPAPSSQATRKYFVPNCVRGECVVEDIRKSAVTACMTAQDCRLRNGTGCCESCAYEDIVAVRNDRSLEERVCGPVQLPCPACLPMKPSDAVPHCDESGHCSIVHLLK